MLQFKMSRQKDLDPFFSLWEDPRCLLSRAHPSVCNLCLHLIQVCYGRPDEMRCIFLLLWQHCQQCLIPWFRTETAHSCIQQSRSMESPEETDVVPAVMFFDAVQKAHLIGSVIWSILVWSETACVYSLSS